PPEHPHLPLPPDHQRDRRGPEFEDPMDPVHRPRLPQPGELQDRDLLPLRRPRPLPTLKPEEPLLEAEGPAEPLESGGRVLVSQSGEDVRAPLRWVLGHVIRASFLSSTWAMSA